MNEPIDVKAIEAVSINNLTLEEKIEFVKKQKEADQIALMKSVDIEVQKTLMKALALETKIALMRDYIADGKREFPLENGSLAANNLLIHLESTNKFALLLVKCCSV